eukprot:7385739-Prymnesium_polylepis.1
MTASALAATSAACFAAASAACLASSSTELSPDVKPPQLMVGGGACRKGSAKRSCQTPTRDALLPRLRTRKTLKIHRAGSRACPEESANGRGRSEACAASGGGATR